MLQCWPFPELYLVVLPQGLPVRHCEEGDADLRSRERQGVRAAPRSAAPPLGSRGSYLPTVAVDVILHVDADGTGALVQDGELRLVVEEPRHLDGTANPRNAGRGQVHKSHVQNQGTFLGTISDAAPTPIPPILASTVFCMELPHEPATVSHSFFFSPQHHSSTNLQSCRNGQYIFEDRWRMIVREVSDWLARQGADWWSGCVVTSYYPMKLRL